MGYRIYIAKAPKKEIEEIQRMNYQEALDKFNTLVDPDEDPYLPSPYKVAPIQLHELGKGVDFVAELRDFGDDIFTFPEAENYHIDYDLFTINRDGLLYIIEDYRKKVVSYYKMLVDSYDVVGAEVTTTPEMHIKKKFQSWNETRYFNYDLREDKSSIVSSWEYEYAVFELVHILKTTDFENDTLVIYGY